MCVLMKGRRKGAGMMEEECGRIGGGSRWLFGFLGT